MIAPAASGLSFGYPSQVSASAESGKAPPRPELRAPTQPVPAAPPPTGVLGQGAALKSGQKGGIGTQGPAPGIQSPTIVQAQARAETRNLRANVDGSIAYAAGARIDTRVTITQKTVEPVTPLKTRAEAMRGTKIDARG